MTARKFLYLCKKLFYHYHALLYNAWLINFTVMTSGSAANFDSADGQTPQEYSRFDLTSSSSLRFSTSGCFSGRIFYERMNICFAF